MRLTVIIRTLGVLFLLFSTTLLPPIGISLYYGDGELEHFSVTFAIALAAGLVLWLPFRRALARDSQPRRLLDRGAHVVGDELARSRPVHVGARLELPGRLLRIGFRLHDDGIDRARRARRDVAVDPVLSPRDPMARRHRRHRARRRAVADARHRRHAALQGRDGRARSRTSGFTPRLARTARSSASSISC